VRVARTNGVRGDISPDDFGESTATFICNALSLFPLVVPQRSRQLAGAAEAHRSKTWDKVREQQERCELLLNHDQAAVLCFARHRHPGRETSGDENRTQQRAAFDEAHL
jgi:hypothetical protein